MAIVAGIIAGTVSGINLSVEGYSLAHSVDVGILVFVVGVIVGASVAFYGYVLDLLADIRDNGDLSLAGEMMARDAVAD